MKCTEDELKATAGMLGLTGSMKAIMAKVSSSRYPSSRGEWRDEVLRTAARQVRLIAQLEKILGEIERSRKAAKLKDELFTFGELEQFLQRPAGRCSSSDYPRDPAALALKIAEDIQDHREKLLDGGLQVPCRVLLPLARGHGLLLAVRDLR